ncbi:MAG TPA: hypothetical protein VGD98_23565 [Ktedonobacteraceae bacterium]
MEPFHLPQLRELQALRGRPALIYDASITDDAVPILYECLHQLGPGEQLDLVLTTAGGVVTIARRLALLLREFTSHLTIIVPYHARSAGTLLCLSANELVLSPLSALSPIDSHISSAGPPLPGTPGMISAEDIRQFRHMAEDWFGVSREKDRLQVLALMAQNVFPPTLSTFYRSEKLMRQAAYELLLYQLPSADASVRQRIVDQLVSGYDAHDHVITRAEARALGLQVHYASQAEEAVLWDLYKTCRRQFLEHPGQPDEDGVIGLIMSAQFCARLEQRWSLTADQEPSEPAEDNGLPAQRRPHIAWKIAGE